MEKGKLPLFAGQQAYINESDLRSVAPIVSRAETQGTRDFLFGMLQGERTVLTAPEAFGHALGLPQGFELLSWDTMWEASKS